MALENWYSAGTVSVESGSTTVTLSGGFWGGDAIMAGDFLVIPSISSDQIAVAGVTSPTELELLWAWPHADAEDAPYFIFYTGIIERSTAQTRKVLEQLGDVKAWYDVIVEDDDARLALETESNPLRAGYRVLVKDDGVIWQKQTSAYGDWIGPVEFKGDTGDKGWTPLYALIEDGDRVVFQLTEWVGGEGAAPDADVGKYLGATGFVEDIEDAVDIRGLGFAFQGAYSGATVYAKGDVVRDNGSSWVALQPTTGNAPPVYPTTSNAYWELLAVKGQDGTGTGDVVGPAVATDGRLAAADGATGKLIKFLTSAQATATLDALVGDSGSGGTKGLVPAPAAGDAAAGKVLGAGGTWVKPAASGRYIGFYNGGAGVEYDLGVCKSYGDPLNFGFGRIVNARSENQSPTLSLDNKIKGPPSPVRVGNEIYVYYDGFSDLASPMRGQIFLEVYDLDGNPRWRSRTPVLRISDIPGAASLGRASVTYDASDVAAPFKMVLSAATVAGNLNTQAWLATSMDGFNWTVLGQAFATGTGFESSGISTTSRVVLRGGIYHIFYAGFDGTRWRTGVATKGVFTAGGWTKNPNNPLLGPRGAYNLAPTATAVGGSRTMKFASNAAFDIGAPIMIWTPAAPVGCEMNFVDAKPAGGTDITLRFPLMGGYGSADRVSQIHSHSTDASEVWFDEVDGLWKAIFTVLSFCPDANRESTGYASTADLNAGFTINPAIWPLPLRPNSVVWDRYSAENLRFVRIE